MNVRYRYLGVVDHLDVVPLYTTLKNPIGSEKTLHPANHVPVRTDLQLLSHPWWL